MKRYIKLFSIIALFSFLSIFCAPTTSADATEPLAGDSSSTYNSDNFNFIKGDTNSFYINSFEADYYLGKHEDNTPAMAIQEKITATFPPFEQNHGIERCLPIYYKNNQILLKNETFIVKRNGNDEPFTTYEQNDNICLKIGNPNSYVTDSQTYTIIYHLKNIISEYNDSENQELYWDVNGNWKQKILKVTAQIHLKNDLKTAWVKDLNCYVGTYGTSGSDRCSMQETDDGASFTTYSLSGGENLTFDIGFRQGTFSMPEPDDFNFIKGDTNSFYIKSFEADYYLDKADDSSSKMRVEEQILATFPPFEQNHGIERCLPLYYKSHSVFSNFNFTVKRNGNDEPFTTYKENGNLCLRIGSANSYVTDLQIYTITYDLKNIISEYQDSENQELYWNTNGTNWAQKFLKLTARVHLSDELKAAWIKDLNCYVGAYGNSDTNRCSMQETDDGAIFTTFSLSSRENLTFDIGFKKGTFSIPEPDKNYIFFILLGIFLLLVIFGINRWVNAEAKIKEKKNLAKSKIISPEFTPKAGFTVAEMASNYLKPTGSSRVASLLELAINKRISLEKGDKKLFGGYKWKIHVHNIDHIPTEQEIILKILNGGKSVTNDSVIEVKTHTATSTLESLSRSFDTSTISSLKNKGLFESFVKTSSSNSSNTAAIVILILTFFVFPTVLPIIVFAFAEASELENSEGAIYVGASYILPALVVGIIIYIIVLTIVASNISKYKKRTLEGIKMSKYMDGLKRYMKLAEEDRIKFLQSVNGADTSNNGIVKLYEKLLPYAVLFKLEDSWLKELNKYYEVEHIENDWVTTGAIISASDFRNFTSYTSSSIASSTSSGSSGSSGGGGGGFSGGGGGGGGGGGW